MKGLLGVTVLSVATLYASAVGAQTNSLGSWSSGPQLPTKRSEVAVAAVGNVLYVIGGYAAANYTPLPRGLNHVGVAAFGGRLYAFGGFSAQNRNAGTDANVYDPAADAWTPLPPLPAARHGTGAAFIGETLYLPAGAPINGGSRRTDTLLAYRQN